MERRAAARSTGALLGKRTRTEQELTAGRLVAVAEVEVAARRLVAEVAAGVVAGRLVAEVAAVAAAGRLVAEVVAGTAAGRTKPAAESQSRTDRSAALGSQLAPVARGYACWPPLLAAAASAPAPASIWVVEEAGVGAAARAAARYQRTHLVDSCQGQQRY